MSKPSKPAIFLFLVFIGACAVPQLKAVPDKLQPGANESLARIVPAKGVQIYECRARRDQSGYEWAFVAPVATLYDGQKKTVGKYYAGPTWESNDGSKVTGKQIAVAPAATPRSIPLQLVKAEPAMGSGAMTGVTYIQRLDTKAGVAPATTCDAAAKGKQEKVGYEARYVFYRQ